MSNASKGPSLKTATKTELRIEDLGVGDRISCEIWSHPFVVVSVDRNSEGPVVFIRRWDNFKLAMLRLTPKNWDRLQQRLGRFYRPQTTPCPHCGRGNHERKEN